MTLAEILSLSPIVPVVTLADPRRAEPLARALVAGGVPAIEITLRTPAALEAIAAAAGVPGAVIGAGTVRGGADIEAAAKAGARFAVSPGATPALIEASAGAPVPLLPGVATASEMMAWLERGQTLLKFFPAEILGGAAALKAYAGPFPGLRFCPTGGLSLASAPSYLALANVICVGGSWLTPEDLLARNDWAGIEALARATTARLARPALP